MNITNHAKRPLVAQLISKVCAHIFFVWRVFCNLKSRTQKKKGATWGAPHARNKQYNIN